jgi:hypothetical protein
MTYTGYIRRARANAAARRARLFFLLLWSVALVGCGAFWATVAHFVIKYW